MARSCVARSCRFLLQSLIAVASSRAMGGDTALPNGPSDRTLTPVWHKFSKQVAGYVDRGKRGPETCGYCHYFIDPYQCVIVEGSVSAATGWCNYGANAQRCA